MATVVANHRFQRAGWKYTYNISPTIMKSLEKRGVSYRRCCRASIRLTISLTTQSRGDHLLSSDTVLVAGDFQGRCFTERIAEIIRPMP